MDKNYVVYHVMYHVMQVAANFEIKNYFLNGIIKLQNT